MRLPECMETAVMSQGRAPVDSVAIREFRNVSTCLVFMVSPAWPGMIVEVVSLVNQAFRSVDLI